MAKTNAEKKAAARAFHANPPHIAAARARQMTQTSETVDPDARFSRGWSAEKRVAVYSAFSECAKPKNLQTIVIAALKANQTLEEAKLREAVQKLQEKNFLRQHPDNTLEPTSIGRKALDEVKSFHARIGS